MRAARRADRSGSGPTLTARAPERFPGATAKFALLGEVLLVGLLVVIVGLAVVTLPAGLAAGVRHLRRFIRAEGSPQRLFWRDVLAALPGGIAVGFVAVVLAFALTFDIAIATSGALPGGEVIAALGWIGLALGAAALLGAAGQWRPEDGWKGALRALPKVAARDFAGVLYLVATGVFVGVVTWALVPLIIPALGCAVFAVVAIPERPRRDRVARTAPDQE
nr:hypothetical protein [Microbacterium halimionae]